MTKMKPALVFLLATIVFTNASPSDIGSLQQSVANLTNLVNQILSKTAQSLDTETTSTGIVIAQLALMQQLVSIGYINTKDTQQNVVYLHMEIMTKRL